MIVVIAFASTRLVSDLWATRAKEFATLGEFITLYGVVFAVIETWRARSASEMAKKAALSANQTMIALFNVKNIAACQSCIGFALQDLEKEGWAPTSTLSRILELYTAEFHEAYKQTNSPQRLAIAMLQSHAASVVGRLSERSLKRLKANLLEMLSDLTAAAGAKMSETVL